MNKSYRCKHGVGNTNRLYQFWSEPNIHKLNSFLTRISVYTEDHTYKHDMYEILKQPSIVELTDAE